MFEVCNEEGFTISTDPNRLDAGIIHQFLAESYWAKNIPRKTVENSIRNSLCFGMYNGRQQIGFARVISDESTFAYLGDVFILPAYRGRGLSKWLMECIMSHPRLQNLRRWLLVTRDAHGLYRQYGFQDINHPEMFMEIHRPGIYSAEDEAGGNINE